MLQPSPGVASSDVPELSELSWSHTSLASSTSVKLRILFNSHFFRIFSGRDSRHDQLSASNSRRALIVPTLVVSMETDTSQSLQAPFPCTAG